MNKSFIWVILIIIIFVGFIALAVWSKNQGATGENVPTFAIRDTDNKLGNGPVILMEYSDFQCPACRAYAPIVSQVLSEVGTDVTFVYRDFPLAQHINAYPASQAAEAAGRQGKFFEMGNLLFRDQDIWGTLSSAQAFEQFKKYATELSLDLVKFETDYKDPAIKDKIKNDYQSGMNFKVTGTPTFYINGEKLDLSGISDVETVVATFKNAIAREKAKISGSNILGTTTSATTTSN